MYETGRMHITAAGDLFLRVKSIHAFKLYFGMYEKDLWYFDASNYGDSLKLLVTNL